MPDQKASSFPDATIPISASTTFIPLIIGGANRKAPPQNVPSFSWSDLFKTWRSSIQIRSFIAPYKDFDPTGNFCRAWMDSENIGTDGAIEQVSAGNVLTYDDIQYNLPNAFEPGVGFSGFGGSPWFNNVNFHAEAGYTNPTYSAGIPVGAIKFPGTSPVTTYRFNVNVCSFRNPGIASGYMARSFSSPADNAAVLVPGILPNNAVGVKVAFFFHGSGGDDYLSHISSFGGTQFVARDTVLALLADGWTVISSSGGPNLNHWGNPTSWTATQAALAWLQSICNVTQVVCIGQSMGGLSALRAAAFLPRALVTHWYGVCPCTNLDWLYLNQPLFTASMDVAFSSSNHTQFLTNSAGCDPMTFAVAQFNGLKMRAAASYSDTTVDRVNNTDALVTYAGAHPTSFTVLTSTGPHSDPSNFNASDIMTFLHT